ncbi:MAG TPA: hypothetical protein PKM88_08160 [bacterium]|nr:hypothetical protein [bacterium]
MYRQMERDGVTTWVRSDLCGRQKEHCLCWACRAFQPEREDKGCPAIRAVLQLATKRRLVLPVWECAAFSER